MATAAASQRGEMGPGWFATALGVLVLTAGGFLAGLLVGIVSQEPELVAGHLAGRSEVVDWSPAPVGELEPPLPAVSAGREPLVTEAVPQPVASERVRDGRFSDYPAAPVVPVAAAPGSYAIQVGAFAEGAAAESLARSLSDQGFAAYVTPSATDSAQRWRVRVGPVETRAEADTIARRLKVDEQLPTWVLNQAEN